MKPRHPIIMYRIAAMLRFEYGFPAKKAVDDAVVLVDRLRARGMEVVMENWMDKPTKPSFDDLAATFAEFEGRTPWRNPELD